MLNSAEPGWGGWQDRILDLLDVSRDQWLRGYTLPRPWYLVPRREELADGEAQELFAVVRDRLLGPAPSDPTPATVRRRVKRVRSGESLPLLFAMRHVGRLRGSTGNYWPAFWEDVFASRMSLPHIQIELAASLAEVWVRTHEYTQGALYYPREGSTNIKWPLAHAGLLRSDEALLEAFGAVLAEEGGDEVAAAPLGPREVDEFLASVLTWLRGGGYRQEVRLAKMLLRTDGTQRTVAELAQRWLQENWVRVVDARWRGRAPSSRSRTPRLGTNARAYLLYDAAENRLLAVLPPSAWPGRVEAKILRGPRELVMAPRYVPTEDETRFDAVNLPVDLSEGDTYPDGGAWLVIDGERRPLLLPSLTADRGLVFGAGDGRTAKKWHAGETYYVLLPEGEVDADAADHLFDDWAVVGPAEGAGGRIVLWARTADPLSDAEGALVDVGMLELAADALGLPELEDLWRTRARLVGGTFAMSEGKKIFAHDEPPLVEVRGLWGGDLLVKLARRGAVQGEYVTVSEARLPEMGGGGARLVEMAGRGDRLPTGEYRLEVGTQFRVFFEVGVSPDPREPGRFEVALEVHAADGTPLGGRLTRQDLARGTLVGLAWPGAELTLRVSAGATWSRALGARADDEGRWTARWRDLGLGDPPGGPLEFSLSWRGLTHATITAADAPYIAEENLTARWHGLGHARSLRLSAAVSGGDRGRRAEVLLVGSRPWDDQLWARTVTLGEGGSLEADLTVGSADAEWLLVLPEEAEGPGVSEPPWLIHRLRTDANAPGLRLGRFPMASLRGRQHDRWGGIVSRLRGASLPVDLGKLLDVSTLAGHALGAPSWRSGGSKWSEVRGSDDLGTLSSGGSGGDVSVAVFYRVQSGHVGNAKDLKPPYLLVKADALGRAARDGGGSTDLFCAGPNRSARKIRGSLVIADADAGGTFAVRAEEEIRACPDCGVVLPAGEAWGHDSPCEAVPCRSRGKKSYVSIGEGKIKPVHLLVRRDPGDVLARVQDVLWKVAANNGSAVPLYAYGWLDELASVYDDEGTDTAFSDWVRGLAPLPRRIIGVREKIERGGNEDLDKLAEMGKQVRRYRPALSVLYRWRESEMG